MLVELRIRDYAVVGDLRLTLRPGLNALTGETGAGKSIIVGALSLLLGERASSGVVRAGAVRAAVEAVFDVSALPRVEARLDELGYHPEDGHLILRREVAAEGRNRAWVNGSPATAGVVGELGSLLVDLHGQHDHQTLLRPAEQRRILDAYAGCAEGVARVGNLHSRVRALTSDLEERETRRREIESRADFLRFQLGEIDGAHLAAGEDDALESEARRLEHTEELAQGASSLGNTLYSGEDAAADRLSEARSLLARLARFDRSLEEVAALLDDAYHGVSEAGRRMGDYAASLDHDPRRLEEVRSRLDLLFRLKRKYGPELADVLATAQRVRAELEELDEADHDRETIVRSLEETRRALLSSAAEVSAARAGAARRLSGTMEGLLPDLGLKGASFAVRLRALDAVGAAGAEAVEFLASPNPGFEPMPLARIASGGELSRVMLALRSTLADVDGVPVLVFDEIDAGIGGVVATTVARKLAEVAVAHQVFVVTHLAQLASRAHTHFLVEKEQGERTTSVHVHPIEGDQRVQEIARMLGGDPESSTSRKHARELLGVS